MSNTPKFDQAFWYSGFDGRLFAELLPMQLSYWFISILGEKYFVTSDIAIPEPRILPFLQTYKFKFAEATWQYEKSKSFGQNPFLILAIPQQAIAISQAGVQSLPQALKSSSVKVFEQKQRLKLRAYIYFIATEDYQFLKIGFSQNPSSRLSELQASRPQSLFYLGSFISTAERFKDICHKFQYLLVRNGWYNFGSELQEYIKDLMSHK